MFQICRKIEFCYGHRLLNYEGKCRHLHGHNGKLLERHRSGGLHRDAIPVPRHAAERGAAGELGSICRRQYTALPGEHPSTGASRQAFEPAAGHLAFHPGALVRRDGAIWPCTPGDQAPPATG